MAVWQHDVTGERFEDDVKQKPGEEGFTRAKAEAHFKSKNFSYVGTPDWEPPAPTPTPQE
jgi:hypothetical protein